MSVAELQQQIDIYKGNMIDYESKTENRGFCTFDTIFEVKQLDKYEYKLKLEQLKTLAEEKNYQTAAEIADMINWRKVKSAATLCMVGEIYDKNKRYEDSREILLMAYDRAAVGRNILYRLTLVALKMGRIEEAKEYYEEFLEVAPYDNLKYVLRYQIAKLEGASLEELIQILEEFKSREYTEAWAFELAYLYHRAGNSERCVEVCDELALWFGDGKYVEKALELKMLYQPLDKQQEEKYRQFKLLKEGIVEVRPTDTLESGEIVHETVQIPNMAANAGRFNTTNLQEELKKSMQQIIEADTQETVSDTIDNVNRMVEEIPYLRVQEESVQEEEYGHIETDEEIDDALKTEFNEFLAEEWDGQIRLHVPEGGAREPQVNGQIRIEDVLTEFEKTKRAAEAAMENAQQRRLDSAKARGLQTTAEMMRRLNEIQPQLDAGVPPQELLAKRYLKNNGVIYDMKAQTKENPGWRDLSQGLDDATRENPGWRDLSQDLEESQMSYMEEQQIDSQMPYMESQQIDSQMPYIEGQQIDSQMPYMEGQQADLQTPYMEGQQVESQMPYMEEQQMDSQMPYMEEQQMDSQIPYMEEQQMDSQMPYTEEQQIDSQISYMEEQQTDFQVPLEEMIERQAMQEPMEGPVEWHTAQVPLEEMIERQAVQEPEDVSSGQQRAQVPLEEMIERQAAQEPTEISAGRQNTQSQIVEMPKKQTAQESMGMSAGRQTEQKSMEIPAGRQGMQSSMGRMAEKKPAQSPMEEKQVREPLERKIERQTAKAVAEEEEKDAEQYLESVFQAAKASRKEKDVVPKIRIEPTEEPVARLSAEQKEIFSYFVPVNGMEKQLCQVLEGVLYRKGRDNTSSSGNILITGGRGSGKTVLATDIIKAIQKGGGRPAGKVGKITGSSLNEKDLSQLLKKIEGGYLIIEQAGEMSRETATKLALLMEQDTGGLLVILEDTRIGMKKALNLDANFAKKFTERVKIPVFTSDELVQFAKAYAEEQECEIDDMAVLALYNRISNIQKLDEATTLTEVKDIVDDAIDSAEHGGLKKVFSRKKFSPEGYLYLREKDFEE